MSKIDRRWLRYASRVLRDAGCSCGVSSLDRWPGYIGAGYVRTRLLIVGAVHNSGPLVTSEMRALRAVAASWATTSQTKLGDARYLHEIRKAYSASVSQWIFQPGGKRGAVWANIRKILSIFSIDFSEVAFTNLAKCDAPVGADTDKVAIECNRHFSIVELVKQIEPLALIVLKDSWKTRLNIQLKPLSVALPLEKRCSNRTGVSEGLTIDQWAPDFARTYWILRLKRVIWNRLRGTVSARLE